MVGSCDVIRAAADVPGLDKHGLHGLGVGVLFVVTVAMAHDRASGKESNSEWCPRSADMTRVATIRTRTMA